MSERIETTIWKGAYFRALYVKEAGSDDYHYVVVGPGLPAPSEAERYTVPWDATNAAQKAERVHHHTLGQTQLF